MAIEITEKWVGLAADSGVEARKYSTFYKVTGLDPALDVRPQIVPTGTSVGCFPIPGSFPTVMPDGRPLIDAPMRVTFLRVVKAWCSGAIVECGMESRIGTFDMAGTFLLNMKLSSAIQYVPSNYPITTAGIRDSVFAKVRYLVSGTSTPYQRIAQLSVPQNRRCVTIVQAEPAGSSSAHFNKMDNCSFTNSSTFWGKPARTWLCTALESDWTGFYDKPWRTTYQFVFNPNQWTGVAYFQDQSLNLPMNDIVAPANFDPGTESVSPYGCKVFRISGESDFNALNLPDITTAG